MVLAWGVCGRWYLSGGRCPGVEARVSLSGWYFSGGGGRCSGDRCPGVDVQVVVVLGDPCGSFPGVDVRAVVVLSDNCPREYCQGG